MSHSVQRPTIALFSTIILVFFSYFGLFFCAQMNMLVGHHATTMAADCDDSTAGNMACPMNLDDHLQNWQRLTTTYFEIAFFLTFVALLVVGSVQFFKVFVTVDWLRLYIRSHQRFKLYNYFNELFAQGIVQPKLLA